MSELTFRPAQCGDEEKILFFIRELAKYEKMESDVVATPQLLREWIFDKQKAEVIFPVAFTPLFPQISVATVTRILLRTRQGRAWQAAQQAESAP